MMIMLLLDLDTKLNPKAEKRVFLGYQRKMKVCRLWDVNACKVIVSTDDVSFNESRTLNEGEKVQTFVSD